MAAANSSPIVPLVAAAVVAVVVAVFISKLGTETGVTTSGDTAAVAARPTWTATAQGRVEPRTGEVRLSSQASGRIVEVVAAVNDKVSSGDILGRIDDTDGAAKVLAADSEAGVRKRERDAEPATGRLAQDRRAAEDKLNTSERAVVAARITLDRLVAAHQKDPATTTPAQVSAARVALDDARKQLVVDREALRQTQIAAGVPLPTRVEAGLTQARSDLSLAEDSVERTRIRAPFDGTILQVFARTGELAAASPEQVLYVIGDLSSLRVRAEVEERDASHVRVGQTTVVRTDAFPGVEFTGKVSSVAQALRPPRLAQRGPRRPSDVDTLEVVVDVDPGSTLMPGMRVDVFFRAEPERPEPPRAEAPRPAPAQAATATPAPAPVPVQPAQPALQTQAPAPAATPLAPVPAENAARADATVVPAPAAPQPAARQN